jgi:valyl-tRNA synthetase
MKLTTDKLEGSRNFANKLWNAARFVITASQGADDAAEALQLRPEDASYDLADRWILSRASDIAELVTRLFEDYQFSEGARALHDFLWSEFCDWYIEIAKIRMRGADRRSRLTALSVLYAVLDTSLRLLHPIMPFVTEAIWQNMPGKDRALMISAWPKAGARDATAEADMDTVMGIVRAVRNARAEFKVEPSKRIEAIAEAGASAGLLDAQRQIVTTLARVEPLTIVTSLPDKPRHALHTIVGGVELYMPLAGMVDLEAERQKTSEELRTLDAQLAKLRERLSDGAFTTKAPQAIVEREQARLAELAERKAKLEERLAVLSG